MDELRDLAGVSPAPRAADPARKARIAWATAYTGRLNYTKYATQTSAAICIARRASFSGSFSESL